MSILREINIDIFRIETEEGGKTAIGPEISLGCQEYQDALNNGITIIKLSESAITILEKQAVNNQIVTLENSVSGRRYREAALGDVDSIEFIKNVDDQIKALRS